MEGLVSSAQVLMGFAGRRVLVTGHTGFKGSWLSLWLARLGADVTGYSDRIPTDPNHFTLLNLEIDDRRGDICDAAALDAVLAEKRPEIIIHLAARSLVREAYTDPLLTYRTNVQGTLEVMEAARRHGVGAMIIATTDKVYFNDETGRQYKEEDELGGSDPYSASKSCVELMARSYRESFLRDGSMRIATVRAGNVIGGGDWAEDRLIPDLMRAAFSGETAIIRNPKSTRPWQHVLDVLAGYLMVGANLIGGKDETATAWNFGPQSDASISVEQLLEEVTAAIPQLNFEVQPDQSGRHESSLLRLDSSKAMTQLDWRPRWESQMLQRTIDWYQAFYKDGRAISEEQLDSYQLALA